MNEGEVRAKVIEFLISITGQCHINSETDLQESELIDSLTMMDLIVFIENEFAVRLDFEDLTPEVFHSPTSLSRLIKSRMPGVPG